MQIKVGTPHHNVMYLYLQFSWTDIVIALAYMCTMCKVEEKRVNWHSLKKKWSILYEF